MMEYWLHAYQNGETGALEGVLAIALDWHRFHIEDNRTSAFEWYDMATGIRASRLAFLLDRILVGEFDVSDGDLRTLMELADLHVEKLLEPSFLSPGNHGLFQLAGLNALCLVIGWRDACEGAGSYARATLGRLLDRWFTAEGVHRENSPFYHGFMMNVLQWLRIAERFQHAGVRAIIERGVEVSPWLTYPDGRWVPVGDTEGIGPRLVGPVEAVCLDDAGSCWAVRDLTESGYAIIRSQPGSTDDASMLFVSAMGGAIAHKHADDLGFVLIEGGREVFVDSGKYGYNRNDWRNYFTSARAHNVPSLVGRPIGPSDIDPDVSYLRPIKATDSGFEIEGVVVRPNRFRHRRSFSYSPGQFLTITDRLYNRTGSGWQSNLHLAPDLHPVITASGFVVEAGDLVVVAAFQGEGCAVGMVRGETNPYQGWVSTSYLQTTPATVVTASCPRDLVETAWEITFQR